MAITTNGVESALSWAGGTSKTSTVTFNGVLQSNCTLVMAISLTSTNTTPVTVSSITDANGNTWLKKTSIEDAVWNNPSLTTGGPSVSNNLELWYTTGATANTTLSITVNYTGGTLDIGVWSISSKILGVNPTNPWDLNANALKTLYQHSVGTSNPTITGFTTDTSHIYPIMASGSPGQGGLTGNWSFNAVSRDMQAQTSQAGTNNTSGGIAGLSGVVGPYSSVSVAYSSAENNWHGIAAALTADPQGSDPTMVATDTSNAQFSTNTTGTITYNASIANEIIVLFVNSEPNHLTGPVPISTVTDTHGLTWTRRKQLDFVAASSPNSDDTLEIWWARSPVIQSGTITVTFPSTIDDAAMVTVSVCNAYTGANPWDANVSLPATVTNPASTLITPTVNVNTSSPHTFIFGMLGTPTGIGTSQGAGTGFTMINFKENGGGVNFSKVYVEGNYFSSAQSGRAVAMTVNNSRWGFIADALSHEAPAGTLSPTVRSLFIG